MNWIDKVYHCLLYLMGFLPGEHITDFLKRQKERLGWIWWAGLAGGTGGVTWLVLHILGYC